METGGVLCSRQCDVWHGRTGGTTATCWTGVLQQGACSTVIGWLSDTSDWRLQEVKPIQQHFITAASQVLHLGSVEVLRFPTLGIRLAFKGQKNNPRNPVVLGDERRKSFDTQISIIWKHPANIGYLFGTFWGDVSLWWSCWRPNTFQLSNKCF